MVRRILVTGANKGIGYAVVHRCLRDHGDTHLVLACRSQARGQAAVDKLVAGGGPDWAERLAVLEMDTSSESSVKAAAAAYREQLGGAPLYGIVNNAGIAAGSVSEVLTVNVRGPKWVDEAFLPMLDPDAGRVVQMSSGAASGCVSRSSPERQAFFVDPNVTWEQIDQVVTEVEAYPDGDKDLQQHGLGSSMGVYGLSKALLNSYTMMLAREHPKLKINSCSPGMIATDLMGSALPWWMPVPSSFVQFLAARVMNAKTPDEGTVSTMHLLFSPELQGNGRYYGSDAHRSPLDKYRSPGSLPYEGP